MGFVRKLTGADAQARAIQNNADQQAAAMTQSANMQKQQLMDQARASADQQAQASARASAEDKARAAASLPLASADVQLASGAEDTSASARKAKKVAFGRNYSSGVSI